MAPSKKTFRIHPDIVFREEDDGAFLFHPATDALRCINRTGAAICRCCDGRHDLDSICRRIHTAYDVPVSSDAVKKDVQDFIDALLAMRLLEACD